MKAYLIPLGLLLSTSVAAQHEQHNAPAASPSSESRRSTVREWTLQPLLLPLPARRGGRGKAILRPVGIEAERLIVFSPAGSDGDRASMVPLGDDGANVAANPKSGNYHWVVARSENEDGVRIASTAWYLSNPGPAPTAMLLDYKHELEILPQPMPREHGSYRESEKWRFLVRFETFPLPNHPLELETNSGSRVRFTTDADGFATVLFPRDQKPAVEGHGDHGGGAVGQFVLSTRLDSHGRQFETAFNGTYRPDPDRSRSLGWGAAFGLIGMLAATPLLRRRNGAKGEQKNA